MAADLAEDGEFDVTIADHSRDALARAARRGGRVHLLESDLRDPQVLARTVSGYGLVLGALPSSIGFEALRVLIQAGRPYCDISFMPQDALELDEAARARGSTAVVDCGVAPGLSNMLAGAAARRLRPCERIEIFVGGIPRRPEWPFFYKAGFSPADVVEEYVRPARLVEAGRVVVRDALSDVEPVEFPGVGPLEAFNTDGLRTLISTLDVPSMSEKTVRYRGHAELMRVFRETGLFRMEPVLVEGVAVRPRDLTAALLFPRWMYHEGEEDLTVLRVVGYGRLDGAPSRLVWEMVDGGDPSTATSSMARTTALPAVAVARLLASGRLEGPGVIPPERIGEDPELLREVLEYLSARAIRIEERRERAAT
jgi:saccharopine dehydrogenase-like NADP-dependent oxidoreductase